jgi:uncharacterized OB-fold protein
LSDNMNQPKRVGVRDGIFTTPLYPSEQARLKGSKCRVCGEVFLGKHLSCGNCANEDMEEIVLSNRGKLYTHTVIRNRPPGDYKGPEPFVPFGEGLIELPEGIRILSPLIGCDANKLKIGTEWQLVVDVLYVDADGNEVMAFKFKPV